MKDSCIIFATFLKRQMTILSSFIHDILYDTLIFLWNRYFVEYLHNKISVPHFPEYKSCFFFSSEKLWGLCKVICLNLNKFKHYFTAFLNEIIKCDI